MRAMSQARVDSAPSLGLGPLALRPSRQPPVAASYIWAWAQLFGNNCAHAQMYDAATGGCRDGLSANGPNPNEGAESTLAWLIALMALHKLQREKNIGAAFGPASRAAAGSATNGK